MSLLRGNRDQETGPIKLDRRRHAKPEHSRRTARLRPSTWSVTGSALAPALAVLLLSAFPPQAPAVQEDPAAGESSTEGAPPPPEAAEPRLLGKPSALEPPQATRSTVPVDRGTRLLERPDRGAPILVTVRAPTELEILDRNDGWIQVRYEAWRGWFRPEESGPSLLDHQGWQVELTTDGDLRFTSAPVTTRNLTEERLARITPFLRDGGRTLNFGPYRLLTDVTDADLLDGLRSVAEQLAHAYQSRYGLALAESPPESIVLFAGEEAYRRYATEVPELAGLSSLGHQSHGLAVTFAGQRSSERIRRILVHELTHLVNRRALPLVVPSWIEEGLAEDLAFSRVDGQGRLVPRSLSGTTVRSEGKLTITGGFASLASLLRLVRSPSWPAPTTLVETGWEDFVRPELRPAYYTQAAFFVRFLLDGAGGRYRDGFHDYLQALARGEGGAGGELWPRLADEPERVEDGYEVWLHQQADAFGIVVTQPAR